MKKRIMSLALATVLTIASVNFTGAYANAEEVTTEETTSEVTTQEETTSEVTTEETTAEETTTEETTTEEITEEPTGNASGVAENLVVGERTYVMGDGVSYTITVNKTYYHTLVPGTYDGSAAVMTVNFTREISTTEMNAIFDAYKVGGVWNNWVDEDGRAIKVYRIKFETTGNIEYSVPDQMCSGWWDSDPYMTETASLVSIHFADGLVSIGERAFYGCGALNNINSPHRRTAVFPASLESIGHEAFYFAGGGIRTVVFPEANHTLWIGSMLKNPSGSEVTRQVYMENPNTMIVDANANQSIYCNFEKSIVYGYETTLSDVYGGEEYIDAYHYAVKNGVPFMEIGDNERASLAQHLASTDIYELDEVDNYTDTDYENMPENVICNQRTFSICNGVEYTITITSDYYHRLARGVINGSAALLTVKYSREINTEDMEYYFKEYKKRNIWNKWKDSRGRNVKIYGVEFVAEGDIEYSIPAGMCSNWWESDGYMTENSSLLFINLDEGLVNIGDSAFYGCGKLNAINSQNWGTAIFPESLEKIGHEAFYYGGAKIHTVIFPDADHDLYIGAMFKNPSGTRDIYCFNPRTFIKDATQSQFIYCNFKNTVIHAYNTSLTEYLGTTAYISAHDYAMKHVADSVQFSDIVNE